MVGRLAYDIGGARLEPGRCRLTGPSGSVHVEPRVADLAVLLAENAGDLVSRDAMIEIIWKGYPGGDQALTSAVSKLRRALAETGGDPTAIDTVPKRGYRLESSNSHPSPSADQAGTGMAVLPFRNLSGNEDDEYLCEGLAEELLSVLTGVPALRVAARASSFALADRHVPLAEVGARLNVSHVLEGSVQRSGERLRVRVRLLEADTESQVWSRDFEERHADLLAFQDSIANAVLLETLDRIGIESGAIKQRRSRSTSSEAFNAYLKGRYFWYRDNTNPGKAFQYFHQAVKLDPDFAAPYAGLVDCYCTYGVWQLMPQGEARSRALDFAERALTLKPESADVQFSHGYAQFYARWRWQDAERAMKRAIEIEPDHVPANSFLGLLAAIRHRDEEAAGYGERLVTIDPLSSWCWYFRGMLAYYRRDYALGADSARESLELEPGSLFALWVASASLAHLGRRKEALELAGELEALAGEADLFLGCAAAAFAVAGDRGSAERVMADLDRRDAEHGVSPLVFSFACSALGHHERALEALQAAYDQRNMAIFYISREPYADPLRDRPGFQRILTNLGLEEPTPARNGPGI